MPVAKTSDQPLQAARTDIDRIDAEMLRLMNARLTTAQTIAAIKTAQQQPNFYRPEREAQVLQQLQQQNTTQQGLLAPAALERLFREIMAITRRAEAALTVAVLGPNGTYSETAARQHFGSTIDLVYRPNIDEIFSASETGHADFAVVPVENSIEGGVTVTLNRLASTCLSICGEINLAIHHNLLSTTENLADLTTVYAHPQSFGQCHRWLTSYCRTAARVPCASNAEAAKKVVGMAGAAAIAGAGAAQHYALPVLAANIEDEPGNTTRFLVLSVRATPPSGNDKTSLLLSCRSKPGALIHLLQPLLDEKIDMTKIESRPAKTSLWEYVFFIDFIGHQQQAHVARALTQLKQEAGLFKYLGSYPAST